MKRLFIAIDLPKELGMGIKEIKKDIKGIKWVKTEQIHLTINFLGETLSPLMEKIQNELLHLQFHSFELETSECGFFPNIRRPSVFWLGLKENPELSNLKKMIDSTLKKLELPCESRKFIPHITLARIKKRLDNGTIEILKKSGDLLSGKAFKVNKFYLFSSQLSQEGAVHTQETEISLL